MSLDELSKRYLTITQSQTDAIITSDRSMKITSWNKGAEKIFGYIKTEVLGQLINIIIPKRFHEQHNRGMEGLIRGQKPRVLGKAVELTALHKAGHEFPIELTLGLWTSGNDIYFSGIIRDITKRKETEQKVIEQAENLRMEKLELEEINKRFITISQSEQDAIITSDESKTICSWNKGAEKLFGYSSEEVIGESIEIIIPNQFRKQHDEGMQRIISGKEAKVLGKATGLMALHKNGKSFPIELTLGSWSSEGKTYFSGIIRDISERKEAERIIEEERKKTESLLQNILPLNVIEELKLKGSVEPKSFPDASILFTDIVGFTKITETLDVTTLVNELNSMFSIYDKILKQRGLEKIKTIGDAYMCAGGIPIENNTHPVDCVLAAIQFLAFIRSKTSILKENNKNYWEIRIGIHTGSLMAGVVGEWKYTYDIWGDSVNTAARIEQSGIPSRINVSQATYDRIKDFFDCSPRGQVEAKNKGQMDMYLIRNINKELSINNEGTQPNEKFYLKYDELKQ